MYAVTVGYCRVGQPAGMIFFCYQQHLAWSWLSRCTPGCLTAKHSLPHCQLAVTAGNHCCKKPNHSTRRRAKGPSRCQQASTDPAARHAVRRHVTGANAATSSNHPVSGECTVRRVVSCDLGAAARTAKLLLQSAQPVKMAEQHCPTSSPTQLYRVGLGSSLSRGLALMVLWTLPGSLPASLPCQPNHTRRPGRLRLPSAVTLHVAPASLEEEHACAVQPVTRTVARDAHL